MDHLLLWLRCFPLSRYPKTLPYPDRMSCFHATGSLTFSTQSQAPEADAGAQSPAVGYSAVIGCCSLTYPVQVGPDWEQGSQISLEPRTNHSLCLLLTTPELAGLKHTHLAFWPKCSALPRESVASVATAKQSCAAHLAEAPTEISLGGRKTIITFSRDLVETWIKAQQEAWIGRDRVIRFLEAKVDRNWVWEAWREESGSRV